MDQGPLVEKQIEDGRNLIEQLARDHVDVTAAAWIKEREDGTWHFYLASRVVEDEGLLAAYRKVRHSMDSLTDLLWVGASDLHLIGATDPAAGEILEILERYHPAKLYRYLGTSLGKVDIEEAYIYPLHPPSLIG